MSDLILFTVVHDVLKILTTRPCSIQSARNYLKFYFDFEKEGGHRALLGYIRFYLLNLPSAEKIVMVQPIKNL
jgi:hypothetical protein